MQIFSALAGFTIMFSIRAVFRRARNTDGLGLGDVKMAGAAAAWISPWSLPWFLLIASVSAIAYAIVVNINEAGRKIPFGPFLGLGLVVIFWLENMQ
jgi:leader peptidase (prepilin peptidase) / N-methyltransferase